jgi:8-oxo-dGTP pyrophosphatase MutT (NUDIX family)
MVFIKPTALKQAGALPYIRTDRGIDVALITSRERHRWIIPKGWPAKDLSLAEAAAIEALEEAGIEGATADEPVGSFVYEKQMHKGYAVPCRVFVFPLLARIQNLTWKEQNERRMQWLPIQEAARVADNKGLCRLLRRLANKPRHLTGFTGV